MRDAVIDAQVEFDAACLQIGELVLPRLAVGHGDRDVVERERRAEEPPLRRRRGDVRILHQRDIMMGHLAVVRAAVEPHSGHRPHIRARPQRAHLLQTDDLGPEPMRLLDVANIEDDVIDADGSCRGASAGCGGRSAFCHLVLLLLGLDRSLDRQVFLLSIVIVLRVPPSVKRASWVANALRTRRLAWPLNNDPPMARVLPRLLRGPFAALVQPEYNR